MPFYSGGSAGGPPRRRRAPKPKPASPLERAITHRFGSKRAAQVERLAQTAAPLTKRAHATSEHFARRQHGFAAKASRESARRHPPLHLGFDLGAGLGFDKALGSDIIHTAEGFPAGLAATAEHPIRQGKAIGRSYAQTYGPLAHGDFGKFKSGFKKHPLGPLLDAFSVASLGAGAGVKAGLLKIPEERTLAFEGGKVHPYASPNPLTRAIQHRVDRYSEARPDAKILGAKARTVRQLPYERERALERAQAPAAPFEAARRKLSKPENFAYDIHARFGDKAGQRLEQEIAFRQKRLAGKVSVTERKAQASRIKQLEAARPHVLNPSPQLQQVVGLGRELAGKAQQVKIDLGELTPESAAARVHLPSRVIGGAKFERQPAQSARAEHVREYPGKIATRERPRTRAEAEARLARIDAANEQIAQRMAAPGSALGKAEVGRRNFINNRINYFERTGKTDKPGMRKALRAGRQKDVSREALDQAQRSLDEFIQKHPDHPVVRAYLKREAEGNYLRELLNSPEDPFTAAPVATRDFGKVKETIAQPGQRVSYPAREAKRASSGFVGAEGERAGNGAFYVPDVSRQAIRSLRSRAGGLGKTQRLVKQSEGTLYTQGRLRSGTKLTSEDFYKTVRHGQHLRDIERAKTFARPFSEGEGLHPGHVFFNPEGVKLPRRLRDATPEELQGLSPKEIAARLQADNAELHANVFPAGIGGLKPAQAAKVMQIDEKLAHAFAGNGYTGAAAPALRTLGSVFDATNNLTKAGLLYLKGAYVPANYAGNLIFGGIQQGAWLPKNLAKAARIIGDLKPATLRRIDIEVGGGGTKALAGEGHGLIARGTQGLANVMGNLADTGPRRAAWLHEAGKKGYKSDAQITKLLEDPKLEHTLNGISQRAEEAMVRFRGLGQVERSVVRRAIFIYPWIKGATRYPARLALDHPVKAALVSAVGQRGHDEIVHRLGQLASYLQSEIPIGSAHSKLGTTVQGVVNPASVTPLGTAADVLSAAEAAALGGGAQKDRLIGFASPALKAGYVAAGGPDPFTGKATPVGQSSLLAGAEQITGTPEHPGLPLLSTIKTLLQKPQSEAFSGPANQQRTFVQQGGPLAALKELALGSARPRELNLPSAQAHGEAEQMAQLSPPERFSANMRGLRKTLSVEGVRALGAPSRKLPPELDRELRLHAKRYGAYKQAGAKGQLERYKVDLGLLERMGQLSPDVKRTALVWAQSASDRAIEHERSKIGKQFFPTAWISSAVRELSDKGVNVTVPY